MPVFLCLWKYTLSALWAQEKINILNITNTTGFFAGNWTNVYSRRIAWAAEEVGIMLTIFALNTVRLCDYNKKNKLTEQLNNNIFYNTDAFYCFDIGVVRKKCFQNDEKRNKSAITITIPYIHIYSTIQTFSYEYSFLALAFNFRKRRQHITKNYKPRYIFYNEIEE